MKRRENEDSAGVVTEVSEAPQSAEGHRISREKARQASSLRCTIVADPGREAQSRFSSSASHASRKKGVRLCLRRRECKWGGGERTSGTPAWFWVLTGLGGLGVKANGSAGERKAKRQREKKNLPQKKIIIKKRHSAAQPKPSGRRREGRLLLLLVHSRVPGINPGSPYCPFLDVR